MTQGSLSVAACAVLLLACPGCKAKPKATGGTTPAQGAPGDAAITADAGGPPTAASQAAFFQACLEAQSAKNWDKLGACYTEGGVATEVNTGLAPLKGRHDIIMKGAQRLAIGLPDLSLTPTLVLHNGDKIAAVFALNGSHKGVLNTPQGELPPSDKKVSLLGIELAQLAPDKLAIAQSWRFIDMGTLLSQIGMSKVPHRGVTAAPTARPTVVNASDGQTEKGNLDIYQQMIGAFNHHDVKAATALLAKNVRDIDASADGDRDLGGETAFLSGLFRAFPDINWQPTDVWAAGDYVVSTGSLTGTNQAAAPPWLPTRTDKPIHVTVAEVVQFKDGKAVMDWRVYNSAAVTEQLGVAQRLRSLGIPAAGKK